MKKIGKKVFKIICTLLVMYILAAATCCAISYVKHIQLEKRITNNDNIQLVDRDIEFSFTPLETLSYSPFEFETSSRLDYKGIKFSVNSWVVFECGTTPYFHSWSNNYINIYEYLETYEFETIYADYNINGKLPYKESNNGKNIVAVFEESLVGYTEYGDESNFEFSIGQPLTLSVIVSDTDNWDNTKKAAKLIYEALDENIASIEEFNIPLKIEVLSLRDGEEKLDLIDDRWDIKEKFMFDPTLTKELLAEIE